MKDRVDKGEVSIKYCPLIHMLADFFTKPLQGRIFEIYSDVLMGRKPILWLKEGVPTKERVKRTKIIVGDKKDENNKSNFCPTRNNFDKIKKVTYADIVNKECKTGNRKLVLTKLK